MRDKLRKLAYINCAGMFLVVAMGALVTKTDSGRGCGDDWPLCNGKFIPAYTIESLIEYSHRFVTGIVGLVLLAVTILVLRHVHHREARIYVLASAFFTIVQSIMGALAVKSPQSSAVMALHFGISLLAFASTFLLALAVREWSKQSDASELESMAADQSSIRRPESGLQSVQSTAQNAVERSDKIHSEPMSEVTKPFMGLVWFVFLYCYVVVYIGAYVRHTDSYAGCAGWPLCNGEIIPTLSGPTGVMFGHRVAALLLFIAVIVLYVVIRRQYSHVRPILLSGRLSLLLVSMQILSGAYATVTLGSDWNLLASLIHTLLISGLFAVLSYLCVIVIRLRPVNEQSMDLQSSRI